MEKKNAETTNNVNESHADPTLNAILMKLSEHESSHQNINDRLNSIMNNGGSPKNNAHNFFNRNEHNRAPHNSRRPYYGHYFGCKQIGHRYSECTTTIPEDIAYIRESVKSLMSY